MESIIQFTCPRCGGHQLMLVERVMHRSVVQILEADPQGKLSVGRKLPMDELCGEPLGFRCATCRYPDSEGHDSSEGFQWHSLEDVQTAGGIAWPDGSKSVEHRCLICSSDGKMTPLLVVASHPGPLTDKERLCILEREQAPHAFLITQSDFGLQTIASLNWRKVKKHTLPLTPSI